MGRKKGTVAANTDPRREILCYVASPKGNAIRACTFPEALSALEDPAQMVWINFLAPDQERLDQAVTKLGFHELAVEDVFSKQSRAKIEAYPGHLFCVMPGLNHNPGADALDVINLNIFLGRNYLISAQRAPLTVIADLKREMKNPEAPLLRGADFVFYTLLDGVVDEYLNATDHINDQLDAVEDRIFGRLDHAVSSSIFKLKHQAAWLRRRIAPQRVVLNTLTTRKHELIGEETELYLRDVHDHVQRVADNLDTFHDLLQGALDVYLTLATSRTNQVMKLVSVIGAVILPLNVLTGLYGTNFAFLPGSQHPLGFWVFCITLLATAASAILLFRTRKWM